MLRRTFLVSAGTAAWVPALGLPAMAQTMPELFAHPMFRRIRRDDGLAISDRLRISFLKRMHGKLLPAVRTSMTTRMLLQVSWTFEMAYDGVPPGGWRPIEDEIAGWIASEIVHELEPMTPLRLVAVDSDGVMINPGTFQPVIGFYADYNPA